MVINFIRLENSLIGLAELPPVAHRLSDAERAELRLAAQVMKRLTGLRALIIKSAADDSDAQDTMALELISLLGVERRS
jgi:hypothetical protein